ncbi:class I SAM-dependent methyltransferase [Halosegnis longus]|uniref:Class I SAM-dependent methyltransferase n=1 Tax=Halosegnis longus TaxID=2216012 RepID=A0AAJ4R7V5_9EURY|nr:MULTISPECIES: class I SAM-dependent methyltransferase [Halobacteriales]RNJ25802.1 class I SAM-dependent methyltransferase [Salella cibi]
MDPENDAYGQLLRDHVDGEAGREILERDDGLVSVAPPPDRYFAEREEWSPREQTAIERAEGRVLDVGCGAGRVGRALDTEVVGIDVSPGAVAVSRERGVDAREVDVTETTQLAGEFDTVVMFGNTFGLVGTRERAPRVLDALAQVTTDDARILADTRDPHATDDAVHREYHNLNRRRGRLPGALRVRSRYETTATPWFDLLTVSPDELREVLAPSPWDLREVVASDERGSYVAELRKS